MGIFKNVNANYILIPMDVDYQKNHLKAYGLTYWTLEKGIKVKWLLNYRGGSFLLPFNDNIKKECIIRGVSYEILSEESTSSILCNLAIKCLLSDEHLQ